MTEAVDGECAEGLLDSAATWRIRGTSGLDLAATPFVMGAKSAAPPPITAPTCVGLLARAGLEVLAIAG